MTTTVKPIDEPAHSPLGASQRYRYRKCPGSVRLCKTVPPAPPSKYALKGQEAHAYGAAALAHIVYGAEEPVIPAEFQDALRIYLTTITEDWSECNAAGHRVELLVEHTLSMRELHPEAFGTADAVSFCHTCRLCRLYDYKNGSGEVVEVETDEGANEQLEQYAVGVALDTPWALDRFELVIVQPNAYHADGVVRRYPEPVEGQPVGMDAVDLIGMSNRIAREMAATDAPDAPLVPGDWCGWCDAAGVCPAMRAEANAIAVREFSPAQAYDPAVLSETLTKLDAIEAWAKQVRHFAYAEAMHGRCPPGWKLVKKRAQRSWKDVAPDAPLPWPTRPDDYTPEQLQELRASYAIAAACRAAEVEPPSPAKLWTKPELLSPAQVEKLIPKRAHAELAKIVASVSSGVTLVAESDKRPAVAADAVSEFALLTDTTEPA